jgi:hypothetical protein
MVMSRVQDAGRSHSTKADNISFEWVEEYKYVGTILTNQNSIQKDIKSMLKSGKVVIRAESFVFHFVIQKFKD